MAKISFSLQKTIANEIIIRSGRANGKQYTTHHANNMFPDSVDIHLEMNGYYSLIYLSLGWYIRLNVCTVILQAP